MKANVLAKIKNAPKEPGVYIFRGKTGVLYVGKAANLKNRLRSYLKVSDIKTQSLHEEATKLDYIVLRSDIEALIEESRLIKELRPKYNVLWRDDKSYLYVYFTKDAYPKIFIGHERSKIGANRIGPFTDGSALRLAMKLLRRHFPYCTCTQNHLRECLNAQIGKCLGYCCKKNSEHSDAFVVRIRYKKSIRAIKMILRGQSKKLLKSLKDEKELRALENIFAHNEYLSDSGHSDEFVASDRLKKVECYDISNLAGKEAVGAMTVLVKKDGAWLPDKNSYRKFKIKSAPTRDDPRMINEVVSRRLNHPEWPYPDLMIIDGGLTQYNAAKKALVASGKWQNPIRLISFAKPQQKIIGMNNPSPELKKLVEQAIYQTHHFVIRYHRQVRRKAFLP